MEGVIEDAEHAARFPGDDIISLGKDELPLPKGKLAYKKIDTSDLKGMRESAGGLDPDQRVAFDIMIQYIKNLRASENSGAVKPNPPLLKVHGGAGSGKSKFINITAT